MRLAAIGVLLLAVLMLGGALRFYLTFGGARDGGEYVIAHDSDPYYHFRRLEYLAQNGAPLVDDAFAAAPARFECVWPVALEYLALGLDKTIFAGERDRESLLLAGAILPILIGLATLLVVFLALVPRTSPLAAALAAAGMAVLPEAVRVSGFAFFDHHCIELFVFVALPALCTWALGTRRILAAAIAGALAFGLSLFAVDGAYLALVAILGGLFVMAWQTHHALREPIGARALRDPIDARALREPVDARALRALALGALGGGAMSSAVELVYRLPRLLPHTGRLGLLVALVGASWLVGADRRVRWAVLLLLVGGGLAVPALLTGAGYLTGHADAITPNIAEAQPMWAHGPSLFLLGHVALAVAAASLAALTRRRPEQTFLAVAAVGGALLGLVQRKYDFLFGLTLAWTIAQALSALPRESKRGRLARIVVVLLVLGFVGQRTAHAIKIAPSAVSPADLAFAAMARKLAAATPPERSLTPGAQPEYTVAVEPSLGPRLLHLGGRAVTAIPFWGTPALRSQFQSTLAALLASDERSGLATLERLRARYLVVSDLTPSLASARRALGADASGPHPIDEALWWRLLHQAGSGSAAPMGRRAALEHFRVMARASGGAESYALFELVRGARIEILALPNADVIVEGTLELGDRSTLAFVAPARAGVDGLARVTWPYASEPQSASAFARTLVLRCRSGTRPIAVLERDVLEGRAIAADCPPF